MDDNIEKMFFQEVREKKKIGNNIHSRVATRKGNGNRALKTPYYFMSRKERKKLNGKVISFNMNEIVDYEKFKSFSDRDQKELLLTWRKNYMSKDIQDKMGISRTIFYRLLKKFDIPTNGMNSNTNRKTLTDEEMEKYLNGEFIDFKVFKTLNRKQQVRLFKKYLSIEPNVQELCRNWQNADDGYLYNLKRCFNNPKYDDDIVIKDNVENNDTKSSKSNNVDDKVETNVISITDTLDNPNVDSDIDNTKDVNEKHNNDNQEPKETKQENENNQESNDVSSSEISVKTNTFTFELNGQYSPKSVIRRVQLALEELMESDEPLNLEIKITNANNNN